MPASSPSKVLDFPQKFTRREADDFTRGRAFSAGRGEAQGASDSLLWMLDTLKADLQQANPMTFLTWSETATTPPLDMVGAAVRDLWAQVNELRSEMKGLRRAVEDENIVVIREVPEAEARQMVMNYFREHPGSYPSDAAMELRLDAALVRDIAAELEQEGTLGS